MMATNITDLKFDDGQQINVVTPGDAYTFVTSKLDIVDDGVLLEYHDDASNGDYRVFLPWASVNRIYQQI